MGWTSELNRKSVEGHFPWPVRAARPTMALIMLGQCKKTKGPQCKAFRSAEEEGRIIDPTAKG